MIRQSDEWFRKFDRWCQDSALVRVDRAFKRFFKQGHGFPRFKAYRRGVQSFESLYKKPTFSGKYGYVKVKGIGRFRWLSSDNQGENPATIKVRMPPARALGGRA